MKRTIISTIAIAAVTTFMMTGSSEAGPGIFGDRLQPQTPQKNILQNRYLNPRLACQLSGGKWIAIVVLGKYGQPAGTRWVCKR